MGDNSKKLLPFTHKNYLSLSLLLLYLIGLMWVLFFFRTQSFSRSPVNFQEVTPQLTLFKSIFQYLKAAQSKNNAYSFVYNVIGNIMLFVPWGFLLARIFAIFRSWLIVGSASSVLSLFAETVQYIFQVGVFDVDDILLNTLGGILGYGIAVIWVRYPTASSDK